MNANFIVEYWPLWIIGLIIAPLLAVLPQLKNIRVAVDKGDSDPKEVGKLFLTPNSIIISIVFGLMTFVCFVLFLASVIIGFVAGIKNVFS